MDLIYTNAENIEQGVLQSYKFDIAFGSDENNFELKLALDDNILEIGSMVYVEGTEYGGIVDSVQIDTTNNEIVYKGRTWHGILYNKTIEPPEGLDYLYVSGDANEVLSELIELCDLDSMFYALDEESGFDVLNYEFRYANLYEGIKKMLSSLNARLEIYRIGKSVCLRAVAVTDYASNEEWDISQKSFVAEAVGKRVNHLICLGQGNLKDRACIHLFASANGEIQPYSNKVESERFEDSDYILDKQKQKLDGIDEICEVYDYSSAEITENYVLTDEIPSDWATNYSNYYYKDDKNYKPAEATNQDVLIALSSSPSNWATKYSNYYTSDGKAVEGIEVGESYEELPQGKNPVNDWAKNYANYYYWKTDGVSGSWEKVSGVDVKSKKVQVETPSDWSSNWKNYYIGIHTYENCKATQFKNSNGTISNKIPEFDSQKVYSKTTAGNYALVKSKPKNWSQTYMNYFTLTKTEFKKVSEKYTTIPTWKTGTFYTELTTSKKAPEWDEYVRYAIQHPATVTAPAFVVGTYYKKKTKLVKPVWKSNKYYELKIDRLAELVKKGVEILEGYQNSDSVEMTLPDDKYEYFIGDKVGATAEAQGFAIMPQAITKKIVVIDNTGINISYEIGGGK